MDGGMIHEFMVSSMKKAFRETGVDVSLQAPTRSGRWPSYIDLLAHTAPRPLAVEVELSSRRVPNDIQKARAVGADLWIVVANQRVARAVRRQLKRSGVREGQAICILTVGKALQRIASGFPLISTSLLEQETKEIAVPRRNSPGETADGAADSSTREMRRTERWK
jgi:hypothetical protein